MSRSKSIHCLSNIEVVFKQMIAESKKIQMQSTEFLPGTNLLQQWNHPRVKLESVGFQVMTFDR